MASFAAAMIVIAFLFARRRGGENIEDFLVAERAVPWWFAAPSIAASWTWAVALLISIQLSYENGFSGLFWFTVPNVIAVAVFIWLGPRIRKKLPRGYSLPEWMHSRFGNATITGIYIVVFAYYQIMAAGIQIYAGGQILASATGLPAVALMPTVLAMALAYTLVSGLRASVVTDVVQLGLIVIIGGLIVAMVVRAAGGEMDFSGILADGTANPFSPTVALTAGVIMTISLLSAGVNDQQFWQRCFAIRSGDVRKSFLLGGLLFAIIPLGLSLLGFTAVSQGFQLPEGSDASLIGFVAVKNLLPAGVATAFLFVLLAGMSSTLDSALSATTSLYALVKQKPWSGDGQRNEFTLAAARIVMVVAGLAGLGLAYLVEFIPGFGLKYLWWFLNTLTACIVFPSILSLLWDRLTARGVLVGTIAAMSIGLPVHIYASLTTNSALLAVSYATIVTISGLSCLLLAKKKTKW